MVYDGIDPALISLPVEGIGGKSVGLCPSMLEFVLCELKRILSSP